MMTVVCYVLGVGSMLLDWHKKVHLSVFLQLRLDVARHISSVQTE